MFEDGSCQHINTLGNETGWKTMDDEDWIYYPQQYINVSLTAVKASFALVGGCCAPNRFKESGFIYEDDGSTFTTTGNKIVRISDRPLVQNITVTGWYMKKFVDDHAMNLTVIPSIHHPDKQSILYEVAAFDRAMLINYQFFDYQNKLIGNYSSGVLRNVIIIPDITLPKYTRRIVKQTLCVLLIFTLVSIPIRFLCRTPSHKVLMSIVIMLGSFILNQAWNIINSQSSIFHEWLPRAAKIVGAYTTCALFGLRLSLDLPSYVITYARNLPFLIINLLAAIPTFIAYSIVLVYFVTRFITYQPCIVCHLQFLEVQDIEERYVKQLVRPRKEKPKSCMPSSLFDVVWDVLTVHLWQKNLSFWLKYSTRPKFLKKCMRKLFGVHEHVRIPFAIKTSLTLLLYCLGQLIPLLLTQMIGVGGVVPIHICSWSPYLSQFQYHPDPMQFAIKTFMLMQIASLTSFTYVTLFVIGFTGTLYFMLEISLIGTFITAVIQLDRVRDLFFRRVGYGVFFASFFISIIVQMLQKRITNLIFIENRTRFGIQHRAPFLHYWYFMMLTSMTRALTSYILRTLKLIFRYPLFSLRVDRNAETWSVRRGDGGFTAYCGMLLAEHVYNNPVVLVFVECLLSSRNYNPLRFLPNKGNKLLIHRLCRKHKKQQQKQQQKQRVTHLEPTSVVVIKDEKKNDALDQDPLVKKRARTRWFLAYTLIQNPGVS
ncbi:MAG: hypothetical protein EXX96DRAFT_593861 [Benjaminiella poitrasii]|nr:MAG: hypothetical protein EXX96DRAFT_593861 [Benjaminiella poitrasii]